MDKSIDNLLFGAGFSILQIQGESGSAHWSYLGSPLSHFSWHGQSQVLPNFIFSVTLIGSIPSLYQCPPLVIPKRHPALSAAS
jgi:hypothetical protein